MWPQNYFNIIIMVIKNRGGKKNQFLPKKKQSNQTSNSIWFKKLTKIGRFIKKFKKKSQNTKNLMALK